MFVTTPDAKGLVNARHPAYRGVFGVGGHASAERALAESAESTDLVVAFGTGFSEFGSGGWSKHLLNHRLVHVDESEDNLIRSPMARLHVRGNLRAICDRLIAGWPRRGGHLRRRHPAAPELTSHGPVTLQAAGRLRIRRRPAEAAAPDEGALRTVSAEHAVPGGRRQQHDMDGPLPAAARVSSGAPRRPVGCAWPSSSRPWGGRSARPWASRGETRTVPSSASQVTAAYLMSGQEITTAAEEKLPVIFVILNDHAYGMVMHGQRLAGAEPIAFELTHVDFAKMAASMGIPAHVIDSPADFERIDFSALLPARDRRCSTCAIDREEVPPMVLRLKTLGSLPA